jgi:putative redox protein
MVQGNIKWTGKRQYVGVGENSGHSVILDLPKDKGGEDTGMRPTELMLLGVAGCTAVDVVNILTKMKIDLTHCEVKISGEQQDDYPKYFHTITLRYLLAGEGLDMKKAEKAVNLSMNKYCSVSQTLKGRAEFVTEIEIL